MSIVSFGCSLTFGTELPDSGMDKSYPTASSMTWPALVSKQLGLDYHTRAYGGIGNLSISDRTYRYVHVFPEPDRFFIINWTFIDRFDYSHPNGFHFNSGPYDYRTCRPNENNELSEFYYRHFHSEYRDKLVNLIYINSVINVLEKHKIKFIMTAIDDLLWDRQWHAPPHVIELQDQIRPYVLDFEGRNFLDWSKHRNFQISASGHPLVDAHQAAAELMLPMVKERLRA